MIWLQMLVYALIKEIHPTFQYSRVSITILVGLKNEDEPLGQ